MARKRIFPLIIILVFMVLVVMTFFPDSIYASIAVSLATVAAGIAIFYQLHRENIIAKGEFILNLDRSFFADERIWSVYQKLFNAPDCKCKDFDENDKPVLMDCLTFFETLYLLIDENVIDMECIDQLFRRRFFILIMNPKIQEIELVTHGYGYVNIYKFDKIWREHLRKKKPSGIHIDKYGIPLSEADPEHYGKFSD
jgi:hypothetical protein